MALTNKRIVITGAAGSLGQAVCQLAQNQEAEVIGLDIVEADSLPNTDSYFTVDLLSLENTQSIFASLGNIDVLANIAGGFTMGNEAYSADDTQWNLMFKLNVETLRNAVKAAVPALKANKGGAIVNIGALGALSGQGTMSAYCASKSTVMRLTESLSEELKHHDINVNAVLPSIIDTQPNRDSMPDANFETWVKPEKLAEVICFLASNAASAVHGALLPVKGLVS